IVVFRSTYMVGDYPKITYRKHTFLSALALGVSAIAIALIVSCTVVIIYGMHFAGEKSEQLVSLVEDAVRGLPTLQKSLPPVFADMLDDHRQPDYSSQLEITAKTAPVPEQSGRIRTSVTVVNNGREVVSLLSLRVVVLDAAGEIVGESNEWAATPFATEDDWPGPMLPGARRYFSCLHNGPRAVSTDALKTEVEITDIRIWSGAKDGSVTGTPKPSETKAPASPATQPAENM
ncbi:MAG: hypothetical protein AAB403_10725, partial [Planctomycetota bacterium]